MSKKYNISDENIHNFFVKTSHLQEEVCKLLNIVSLLELLATSYYSDDEIDVEIKIDLIIDVIYELYCKFENHYNNSNELLDFISELLNNKNAENREKV